MANVLSVDDDMAVAELLKEVVTGLGHEFRWVADPTGVGTAVGDYTPDLIILDMQMPAGGSPMAMKTIESHPNTRNSKIICFSSLPIEQQRELVPPRPGLYYLVKTFDLPTLRAGITQVLGV
jgi:CheY-like chemotaxis protein